LLLLLLASDVGILVLVVDAFVLLVVVVGGKGLGNLVLRLEGFGFCSLGVVGLVCIVLDLGNLVHRFFSW
jgi:hypothetical protein